MSEILNPTIAPTEETIPASSLTSAAAFPRVDLLPPAIKEEGKVRTARLILGGAVTAAIVLTGGLYLMANSEVSSAQVSLDDATSRSTQLSGEIAKYSNVPLVYGQVGSAQAALQTAMAGDVRWSSVLNQLSVNIPAGVSLSEITIAASATAGQPTTAASTGKPGALSELGTPGIATIKWTGTATSYAAFASFLQSMSRVPVFSDVFSHTVSKTDPKTGTVLFETVAVINDKALSHRYDVKAGR